VFLTHRTAKALRIYSQGFRLHKKRKVGSAVRLSGNNQSPDQVCSKVVAKSGIKLYKYLDDLQIASTMRPWR